MLTNRYAGNVILNVNNYGDDDNDDNGDDYDDDNGDDECHEVVYGDKDVNGGGGVKMIIMMKSFNYVPYQYINMYVCAYWLDDGWTNQFERLGSGAEARI